LAQHVYQPLALVLAQAFQLVTFRLLAVVAEGHGQHQAILPAVVVVLEAI
jgi:hypothetical protein